MSDAKKTESTYWLARAILMLGVGSAAVSNAADYYVSPQGKDSAAGSEAAPWQSLAKACETAAPGDTVTLREGIYRETLRNYLKSKWGLK